MPKNNKKITKTIKTGWYGDEMSVIDKDGNVIPNVEKHTQILHFKDGTKKTILSIVRIDEGEFLTLTTASNKEFIINKQNVNLAERFIE